MDRGYCRASVQFLSLVYIYPPPPPPLRTGYHVYMEYALAGFD